MVTTFYPNLGQFALTSPTRFLLLLLDLSSSGCDDVYFGLNFFGRKHDCNFFPFSFLLSLTNDQDSINLNNPPNLEEEARQCGVVGGWQMGQVGSNRDEERKKEATRTNNTQLRKQPVVVVVVVLMYMK